MKLHLSPYFLIVTLLLFYAAPIVAQTDDSAPQYEIEQLSESLYRISSTVPAAVNMFASIGKDGVLIVDTGFPLTGPIFKEAMSELTDKPIDLVLITHTHLDHTGGLGALAPNSLVFVHKNGIESSYFSLEPLRQFGNPTVAVSKPMTIHFNGEDINLVPLPPGHSDDEMIIHFIGSNVLCVGSRILPVNYPFVDMTKQGDLDEVFARIEEMAKHHPDARFASSHGPVLDARQALEYRKYFVKLSGEITDELKEGMITDSLAAHNAAPGWNGTELPVGTQTAWINQLARIRGITEAPKTSVVQPLTDLLLKKDGKAAVKLYKKLKKKSDEWSFTQAGTNMLGYQLMYRNRVDDAIDIFKLNIEEYPESANTYDSYGEALLAKGDTTAAIEQYEKALEVNPQFVNAENVLKGLRMK